MFAPSKGDGVRRPAAHVMAMRKPDMQAILEYLKKGGERLDSEIAAATGFPLAKVRQQVKDLHARGAVMVCRSIRYTEGKEIEGVLCRIAGYTPPAAPGRKAKPKTPAKALAED
jgi:hypothetical protein